LTTPTSPHIYLHAYGYVSRISKPFSPPVFDHFQYTNTEMEGLGDLVMSGDVR